MFENFRADIDRYIALEDHPWFMLVSGFIEPGAKLFGRIEIDHGAAIGANAVVTKDIPAQAVAVGIPAKIISYQGAQDYVIIR
jgi:hypothetical protein